MCVRAGVWLACRSESAYPDFNPRATKWAATGSTPEPRASVRGAAAFTAALIAGFAVACSTGDDEQGSYPRTYTVTENGITMECVSRFESGSCSAVIPVP